MHAVDAAVADAVEPAETAPWVDEASGRDGSAGADLKTVAAAAGCGLAVAVDAIGSENVRATLLYGSDATLVALADRTGAPAPLGAVHPGDGRGSR